MKKLIPCLLIALTSQVMAQRPDFAAQCKTEMQKLSYLVGDWKGEASVKNQNGTKTVAQSEHIEWKVDGLVLSIEGTGSEQDKITFQAFAVVNFDITDQQFKLKSFVKEGFSSNAYFKVQEENRFEWGFDIPTGSKNKYTITLDPSKKTWYEVGEYSRDGNTWLKFIELNLTKQ
jgi:hypothetical protein